MLQSFADEDLDVEFQQWTSICISRIQRATRQAQMKPFPERPQSFEHDRISRAAMQVSMLNALQIAYSVTLCLTKCDGVQ